MMDSSLLGDISHVCVVVVVVAAVMKLLVAAVAVIVVVVAVVVEVVIVKVVVVVAVVAVLGVGEWVCQDQKPVWISIRHEGARPHTGSVLWSPRWLQWLPAPDWS